MSEPPLALFARGMAIGNTIVIVAHDEPVDKAITAEVMKTTTGKALPGMLSPIKSTTEARTRGGDPSS